MYKIYFIKHLYTVCGVYQCFNTHVVKKKTKHVFNDVHKVMGTDTRLSHKINYLLYINDMCMLDLSSLIKPE